MVVFCVKHTYVHNVAPFTDMLQGRNTASVPMPFELTGFEVIAHYNGAIRLQCNDAIVHSVYQVPRLTMIDS